MVSAALAPKTGNHGRGEEDEPVSLLALSAPALA